MRLKVTVEPAAWITLSAWLLLMPLQRKLRFDETLSSFSAVTNGNTVLSNVQVRLKT